MATFLLEIGLEEMPAHLVAGAEAQLVQRMTAFLAEERLTVGAIQGFSTPRRLAVQLQDVAETTTAVDDEFRGPSLKIAKDDAGNWSKAALGFARGKGATPADFIEKDGYVYVKKHVAGEPAAAVLAKVGAEVVAKMTFATYMKWADNSFTYVRPIRWLVGLLDADVVDFSVLTISSDRVTRGHRFLHPENVSLAHANDYQTALKAAFVIADAGERQATIMAQIDALAAEHGWQVPVDADLLAEVTNIVEWPTAFAGQFDTKYLALPDAVLITSMREHQRFFFVQDDAQAVQPFFIAVRNGNADHLQNVVAGNEKVLVARLEDALFFYNDDQQHTIADAMAKVDKLVFHEKIGTVREHMARAQQLAATLGAELGLADDTVAAVGRASQIYKFDLMTGMVGEFDELQGIMGEHYALQQGETALVAQAIREHYQPTSATGDLPASDAGAVLALADKLDSIVSFFNAGLIPSGSNDPYGLRRAATGIVRILLAKDWHVDCLALVKAHGAQDPAAIQAFLVERIRKLMSDSHVRPDVIAAGTVADGVTDLVFIADRTQVLAAHAADANFRTVIEALTRVERLAQKQTCDGPVVTDLFDNDAEQLLFISFEQVQEQLATSQPAETYYAALSQLAPTIATYFDETMIMDDDQAVQNNRLAQVTQLHKLITKLGDLGAIVVKG